MCFPIDFSSAFSVTSQLVFHHDYDPPGPPTLFACVYQFTPARPATTIFPPAPSPTNALLPTTILMLASARRLYTANLQNSYLPNLSLYPTNISHNHVSLPACLPVSHSTKIASNLQPSLVYVKALLMYRKIICSESHALRQSQPCSVLVAPQAAKNITQHMLEDMSGEDFLKLFDLFVISVTPTTRKIAESNQAMSALHSKGPRI